MTSSEQAQTHPFFADRPIEARSDDLLGRAQFAEALAEAIGAWRERDSLVIGIYGGWGSGKTSTKNMMLEALQESALNVHPVEFNPWEWSSQDRLFEAFFSEIGTAVGHVPGQESARLRRWAQKWQQYGTHLRAGATAFEGIRSILGYCSAFLGAGLLVPGLFLPTSATPIFVLVAIALFLLAGFLRYSERFADQLAKALLASAGVRTKTASEIKQELQVLLRGAKQTLVIVIDDIDRLPEIDIFSMFQLVKGNADLPGVVYVLLFDKFVVDSMLRDSRRFTPDFIDKIVQVAFDVPAAASKNIEGVLFAELNSILATPAAEGKFQQDRWSALFLSGLKPYFSTMRHVRRYASSLSFHAALLSRTGTLEVNLVDLIGLETLRVFEGTLYQQLPRAKAFLVGDGSVCGFRSRNADQEKHAAVERLLALVTDDRRSAVTAILRVLFPAVDRLAGGVTGNIHDSWARETRACNPEFFDRYFQLWVPEDEILQQELEDVLSRTGNREQLVRRFAEFRARGLVEALLERLDPYRETIDSKDAISFITALFDIGDGLRVESVGFFEIEPIVRASRLVIWCLRQQRELSIRGDVILEAARQSAGIRLLVRVTAYAERERSQGDEQERLVSEDHLVRMKECCVAKIQRAAKENSLSESVALLDLLYRWREWAGEDHPRRWVASLVSTPEGVIRFLVAVTTPYTVNGHVRWKVRLTYVEDFADVESVRAAVVAGFPRELNAEEARAVREFEKAVRRRSEGKTDDDHWGEGDDG